MALVATAASAAQFAPNTNRFNPENAKLLEVASSDAMPSAKMKATDAITPKHNPAKSDSISTTEVPDFSGQYIMTYTFDASKGVYEDEANVVFESSVMTLEKQDDDTYLVKGFLSSFFGKDANDLTATVYYNSTYNRYFLSIDPAQIILSRNERDYYLYYYGLNTDDNKWYYYLKQPLEFWYYEGTGEWFWAYEDSSIMYLFEYDNQMYGNEISDCCISPVNAVMTGMEYLYDSDTQSLYVAETSYPMWCDFNENSHLFTLAQFGGLPNVIYLYYYNNPNITSDIIDGFAVNSAFNINQIGGNYYVDGQYYDFVVASQSDNVIHGYVTNNEDGSTTIDFPNGWICWNTTINMHAAYFESATITINGHQFGTSSVDNVAIDNTNAPVEYYNIQGMRINNPEAGQLVIRRQGTSVSKQIMH
jgi:hypothetical protein